MSQQFQLKALIVGIDKLSPVLREIKKNLGGFRREMKSFGKGGLEMAAGLGAGIALASKSFADFEDAGLRLKSSLMGMTGAVAPEFENINKLALELGNKLPGNTSDFQNMMTALVQQGVSGQEILSGIGEAAAYLGVQLKLAPEQAAEFAAKMRTATGTVGKDMMGLMDVIQRTANLGVRSDDMLAGFAKLTPALDMLKIKGLEAGKAFAPLLAMAIRSGMAGESAGNAYRKMFQSFFDPTKMKAANTLLSQFHQKMDFTNGQGEFGGLEKMFTQLQKLQGLTTAQRVPILKKLFGDDAETLQVVSNMISGGMPALEAMKGKLEQQASLQKRVESQLTSLKNLFDAAMGNAQNLLASIGGTFAPEVKQLTDSLGQLASWAQNFVRDNPQLIRGIVASAMAFVGLKLAALAFAGVLGGVTALLGMSGIGLALRGLALATGIVISKWDTFGPIVMPFLEGMWSVVKMIGSGLAAAFEVAWWPLKQWWNGLVEVWHLLEKVHDFFSGPSLIAQGMGGTQGQGSLASSKRPLAQAIGQRYSLNGAIDVRFANAPQGMRVTGVQSSQPNVGLNPDVGYNSFALGMP